MEFGVRETFEKAREYVFGQDESLERLCEAVNLSLRLAAARSDNAAIDLPRASSICLMGPTASGKTHMVRTVCNVSGLKFFSIDTSSLAREGWQGTNVSDVMKDVEVWQADHVGEPFVMFWDEFDKVSGKDKDRHREGGAIVNMLKVLECDDTYTHHEERLNVSVDMRCAVHVLAGAFTGIESIVAKRVGAGLAGFTNDVMDKTESVKLRALCNQSDLRAYGLPPELIGRISCIIEVPELDVETLERIVVGKRGLMEQFGRLVPEGCEVRISDETAHTLAELASDNEFGARYLMQKLSPLFAKAIAVVGDECNVATIRGVDEASFGVTLSHDESIMGTSEARDGLPAVTHRRYTSVMDTYTASEIAAIATGLDTQLRGGYDGVNEYCNSYMAAPGRSIYMLAQRVVSGFERLWHLSDDIEGWSESATVMYQFSVLLSSLRDDNYVGHLFSHVVCGHRMGARNLFELVLSGGPDHTWESFLTGEIVPYVSLAHISALGYFCNHYKKADQDGAQLWHDRFAYRVMEDPVAARVLLWQFMRDLCLVNSREAAKSWARNLLTTRPERFAMDLLDSVGQVVLLGKVKTNLIRIPVLGDLCLSLCLAIDSSLVRNNVDADDLYLETCLLARDIEDGKLSILSGENTLGAGQLFIRFDEKLCEYLDALSCFDEKRSNWEVIDSMIAVMPGLVLHTYNDSLAMADFVTFNCGHATHPAYVTRDMISALVDGDGDLISRQAEFMVDSGLYLCDKIIRLYGLPEKLNVAIGKMVADRSYNSDEIVNG